MASGRNNRRRRRSRGRFGFLFKLLCALALLVALTVGATVFFRVEYIEVSGNVRYTQEEVAAATGIQIGDNLYGMNKNQVARQVRQTLPYVEELSIWRSLPNAVVIRVAECQAAARVAVPDQYDPEPAGEPEDSGGEGSQDREDRPAAAREPWLISAAGKLLEVAPEDSTVMLVSGITPLAPRAGTPLELPREESAKKEALLSLLAALEELDLLGNVSAMELGNIQIKLRYLNRFDVKLPLNGDFRYQLRVLEKGVEETTARHGEESAGTMDLTQKQFALVYSPSREAAEPPPAG